MYPTSRAQRGCHTRRWNPLIGLLLAALVPMLAGCSILGIGGKPKLTDEQRSRNVASFDYVWQTIKERHWDTKLGGVDWNEVKATYRPRVEEARTMSDARAAMEDALAELDQSHFGIIPREAYGMLEMPDDPRDGDRGHGGIRVDLRVVDDEALITAVRPGPAADAGVTPGWRILAIGDESVKDIIQSVREGEEYTRWPQLMLVRSISIRLRGDVGDPVAVKFKNGDNDEVELILDRVEPLGNPASIGHLPTMYVRFESRLLEENVGYIGVNAFLDPGPVMTGFEVAIESFQDADGVIIDLRGNPGGIGIMSMGMAGFFLGTPNQYLGTMHMRSTSLKFVVNPRITQFDGPLAILVDELSMSTSEILAGGLQDLGRARVFGAQTPGAALPSTIERLPNGDGFQYAIANYVSAGGQVLEGRGVTPDQVVAPNRKDLLKGRDPVIHAATEWIRKQR